MIDVKPSNPKDIIGSSKLPLELVPDTAVAFEALGYLEGACKYGRYNWRITGVRASIYRAAVGRHLMKWWNGEDADPVTGVHHLASARADLGILIDAMVCDKLVDDRPPAADLGTVLDCLASDVVRIKELFKGHSPYQWTIADTEGTGDAWEPIAADDEAYQTTIADPTDAAYEDAVCLRYSASPAAGVTLGPYSSQEALDKALYRWTEYREVLGETEDHREARLRREQEQ